MQVVRDLTMPKSDYKGHPCYALDVFCPCRPCYSCHDCKPPSTHNGKMYSDVFHCATNWNSGCPDPLPVPVHDLNRAKRCRRCGQYVR